MRRLFSIIAIAALIFQGASPLVAAVCPHTQQMPACHRAQQATHVHHCEGMESQQQTEPAGQDSDARTFKAIDSPANCPMDCCGASAITNAAALAAGTSIPQLVVTDRSCGFVPVTFTSNGFSSHTDRGPPTT